MDQLLKIALQLRQPGLEELIRLIGSDKFADLTDAQIRDIGNYKPIRIDGETFFDRAFSRSKEAAAILRLAKGPLGQEAVLAELNKLQADLEEH